MKSWITIHDGSLIFGTEAAGYSGRRKKTSNMLIYSRKFIAVEVTVCSEPCEPVKSNQNNRSMKP